MFEQVYVGFFCASPSGTGIVSLLKNLCCFRSSKDSIRSVSQIRSSRVSPTWSPSVLAFFPPVSTVPTASSHRSTLDALENVPTAPADQTEQPEYHHLGASALCFGWLSRNEERKEGSAGGAHKSDAERREPLHRRVYNTLCSNSCVMM
jgi:hypothetical protein